MEISDDEEEEEHLSWAEKVKLAEQGLRPRQEDDWHYNSDGDSDDDGMYREGPFGETMC